MVSPLTKSLWGLLDCFRGLETDALRPALATLDELLAEWNEHCTAFNGDPSHINWTQFRPLRLSSEPDWSDWLTHLLVESRSGRLAWELFGGRTTGRRAEEYARPTFPENAGRPREVPTETGYKADIVLMWSGPRMIHVEVKLYDQNFDKTFFTANDLHLQYASAAWEDFILIPEESSEPWRNCSEKFGSMGFSINPITWRDVAVALRRSVASRDETLVWSTWGLSFCGAIEQKLLGHPWVPKDRHAAAFPSIQYALALRSMIEVLTKARPESEGKPMMTGIGSEDFLKEGIVRGSEVLDVFVNLLEAARQRVERFLREKQEDWGSFVRGGPPSSQPLSSRVQQVPTYTNCDIRGLLGAQECSVKLGVWWRPPQLLGTPCIIYAGILDVKGNKWLKLLPRTQTRVKVYPTGDWLYVVPSADVDFDRDCELLISTLLEAAADRPRT